MSQMRKYEIEQTTGGFRIRIVNAANQEPWTYIQASAVKSVVGVEDPGFGTRDASTLQRKNPVRHTDKREFIVNFHDENESAPLRYNIEDVDNQPTWTNDAAGLEQAIADISSWCAGSAGVSGALSGNVESPRTDQNTTAGATSTTPGGAKAFSILFEGTGGTLATIPVDSGYSIAKAASLGNTLDTQTYTVPTAADPNFPNSPRVLIEYIV